MNAIPAVTQTILMNQHTDPVDSLEHFCSLPQALWLYESMQNGVPKYLTVQFLALLVGAAGLLAP
jgi:hypothetical protein